MRRPEKWSAGTFAAGDPALLERMLDFQEELRDAAHAKGAIVREAADG